MKGMQKLFYRSTLYFKRHTSTILTCIGAAGVVATAVMAVKVTPKAIHLLEEATDEKGEELTKLEVVRVVGPVYIPAAAVGISTIACIFGANVLNHRNQAVLTSAYAMLEQSFKRYREAAKSVYGEDADSRIRAEVAKKISLYDRAFGTSVLNEDAEENERLFYDSFSQRYFSSTMAAVLNAQYHLNRNFALRGWVDVNEFYEFLGLKEINGCDAIGWSSGEMLEDGLTPWVDFNNELVKMDDGLECYIVSPCWEPTVIAVE